MIVTFKSYVQLRAKTRVFLASKTSLSIPDHLQATFINRSTCQAYIETLRMPLTHKQPKKWWTNRHVINIVTLHHVTLHHMLYIYVLMT